MGDKEARNEGDASSPSAVRQEEIAGRDDLGVGARRGKREMRAGIVRRVFSLACLLLARAQPGHGRAWLCSCRGGRRLIASRGARWCCLGRAWSFEREARRAERRTKSSPPRIGRLAARCSDSAYTAHGRLSDGQRIARPKQGTHSIQTVPGCCARLPGASRHARP